MEISGHLLPALLEDILSCPDMLKLGEGIVPLCREREWDNEPRPQKPDILFWEAVNDAIEILESHSRSRQKQGRSKPEEVEALMREVASRTIDDAFSDEFSIPSQADQRACVELALALNPRCSDAHLIVGMLQEKAGQHQLALIAYRTAMRLASETFGGEEALMKHETTAQQEAGLWYELEGRDYLRPRAALAALLWKLENYPQAIAHYQAMLNLNPSDNQGHRHALLCLLLEAGDDEALGEALARFHFSDRDAIEPRDRAGTIWHYTNACWLYRRGESNRQEATRALQEAFKHNHYVPYMLLVPEGLPELDRLSAYSKGDGTEAAMYVNMALLGWQRTSGALDWLEETARATQLFRTGKQGLIVPRMTINVLAEASDEEAR